LTYDTAKEQNVKTTFDYIEKTNVQKKKLVLDYLKDAEFDVRNMTKTISFLQEQATQNIVNIQSLQKSNILSYYSSVEKDVASLSKKDLFQYIFSFKNRGKTVNDEYLGDIYKYKEELDIENILMINRDGKIIYSSDQKALTNTNVVDLTLPFKEIWEELKLLKYEGKRSVRFVDFGYDEFSKSYKQFAIAPFKDVKGFIVVELNQDSIQKIIENMAALGNTAETYLTYKRDDKTYLASNRSVKMGKVGDEKRGEYVDRGFVSGGTDTKYGSLGDIELVGYMPIKFKNLLLSLQTTVNYTEIVSPLINGEDYFEQFMSDHRYHNIMLIGPKGDMFYSIERENDYNTNILYGRYSKTHFAKALREVFKTKDFVLSDVNFYAACEEELAQFALYPILNEAGEVKTVVVIQLRLHALSNLLVSGADTYETKETYVVGRDKKLRTSSILSPEVYSVLESYKKNLLIDTQTIDNVLRSEESTSIIVDYRGKRVLSSASLLKYANLEWIVVTEIDEAAIDSVVSGLKFNILVFVLISSIVVFLIMFLITNEKKKHDKKLKYNANHDSLTSLPNRKFALEFLSYVLANSKRLKTKGAVLYIDLDKFKFINDSYGHESGDVVIKEVALRLKKALREEDLLARFGGDEFILMSITLRV